MVKGSVTLASALGVSLESWSPGEGSVLYDTLPRLPRTLMWAISLAIEIHRLFLRRGFLRKVMQL